MEQNINDKIDEVVIWLRKQVNNCGAKGLVVGISGCGFRSSGLFD